MKRFEAQIQRPSGSGTWHYLQIPFDTATEFGAKGQIKVRAIAHLLAPK